MNRVYVCMKFYLPLYNTAKTGVMKRFLSLLAMLCICGPALPNGEGLDVEYASRCYTTDDGLPSILTQCLCQDGQGFIWVGGASGLARFDGFGFKSYLKGRMSNLFHLDTDPQGGIRAFANDCVYTLDTRADTLRRIPFPDGYKLTTLSSEGLPAGYGIFYSGERQALFAIRDTCIVEVMHHPDIDRLQDNCQAWYDTAAGLLYLPLDNGVSVISAAGQAAFHAGLEARAFAVYQGALWAIAQDGLYRLEGEKFKMMVRNEIDRNTGFVTAAADSDGGLLFKDYNTLYRYRDGRVETIFTANAIRDIMVDSEGNIWVATYHGLYNLFRLQFRNYTPRDGNDMVKCVVHDPAQERVVAGTLNGTLFEIRGQTVRELRYPENPYGAAFFDSYPAAFDGAVYLPGPGDVLQLKGGEGRWMSMPFHDPYQYIVPQPGGSLLCGGETQFYTVSPAGTPLKEYGRPLYGQRVYAQPCTDSLGRTWWGGFEGVSITAGDTLCKTIFREETRICQVMNTDRGGGIWIASENRLFRSDGDTVRLVKTLPTRITNIHFTRANLALVAALDGIYLFDEEFRHSVFYNHQNGFTGIEPLRSFIAEDGRGELWITAVGALVRFDPDALVREQQRPRLHILQAASSRDNIRWLAADTASMRLRHNDNNIRFDYIGLSYSAAQNVRYRYRLEGFQQQWSKPAAESGVTFNNLPPGRYLFQLTADAGTPETQTTPISLHFEIRPALWQTWWFRAAAILALFGVTGWGTELYLRRKHAAQLARAAREREMNELRVQSIRLKSIPHFNSNVLAGIEYVIMKSSREEANRLLALYSTFTNRTLQEIDRPNRTLAEEIEYVRLYLQLEKLRYGDKLSFEIEVAPGAHTSVMVPNMVLHTYAENAVKHGIRGKKEGGRVTVKAVAAADGVLLSVEDDGIGREASRLRDPSRKGHGLAILNRQIELYNQQNAEKMTVAVTDLTTAEGRPGGTRFELYVPHRYNYM